MLLWMLHIQLIWSRVRLHVFMCAWMKASLSSLFAIMLSLRQKHQGSSTPLSRHLPLLCECMCAVYVFCLPVRILICQVAVRHMYAYFLSHFLHPHHPPFFFSLNICQPLSDKQCTEFHFNPIVFACVRGNVNFDNVWFSFLSNMTVIACRPLGWCVSVYVCVRYSHLSMCINLFLFHLLFQFRGFCFAGFHLGLVHHIVWEQKRLRTEDRGR